MTHTISSTCVRDGVVIIFRVLREPGVAKKSFSVAVPFGHNFYSVAFYVLSGTSKPEHHHTHTHFLLHNPHHIRSGHRPSAFTSPLPATIGVVLDILYQRTPTLIDVYRPTGLSYHLVVPFPERLYTHCLSERERSGFLPGSYRPGRVLEISPVPIHVLTTHTRP